MVRIQAHTIRPATIHRTELAVPTPAVAPAMVWVVLTGMPKFEAKNRVRALGNRTRPEDLRSPGCQCTLLPSPGPPPCGLPHQLGRSKETPNLAKEGLRYIFG